MVGCVNGFLDDRNTIQGDCSRDVATMDMQGCCNNCCSYAGNDRYAVCYNNYYSDVGNKGHVWMMQ